MFRFSRIFMLVLAVLALGAAGSAQAKTDDAAAQRLQALFTDIIKQYGDAAAQGGAKLITEGQVIVERSKTYYAVTLPVLSWQAANGSRTEIGMIAINALPGDADGEWKMTVAIPSPITAFDPSGRRVITADLRAQNFAGVWHEKFRNFTKISAEYRDVSIYNALDRVRITLPALKIIYDLRDNGSGLWSGPAQFVVDGFKMNFEDGRAAAAIQKIELTAQVKDYALAEAAAYEEKIAALGESQKQGAGAPSGVHMLGMYNLVFDFLSKAWDGFSYDVILTGFDLDLAPVATSPPGKFLMNRAHVGFGMEGFRRNDVSLKLKGGFDGLSLFPLQPGQGDLMPARFNIDLSINKLPFSSIVSLGGQSLGTAVENPAMAQMAGLQTLMMLPKLMTDAGTNLTLSDFVMANTNYDVLANGAMTADLGAIKGYTGKMRMEIAGLDYIISSLNAALRNPATDPAAREKIQKNLQMLGVMQLAGQQGTNAAGKAVRTYDFELNQKGETLLNGTDLMTLVPPGKGP